MVFIGLAFIFRFHQLPVPLVLKEAHRQLVLSKFHIPFGLPCIIGYSIWCSTAEERFESKWSYTDRC